MIVAMIPVAVIIILFITRTNIMGIADCLNMAFSWLSAVNTICTIMVIHPFRKAMFGKGSGLHRVLGYFHVFNNQVGVQSTPGVSLPKSTSNMIPVEVCRNQYKY
uniref:Uncharacterized protein n=1 Tax=Acrobeloides nanus TaxID=290746 RepID=A0A914D842_9BILA